MVLRGEPDPLLRGGGAQLSESGPSGHRLVLNVKGPAKATPSLFLPLAEPRAEATSYSHGAERPPPFSLV